MINVSDIVQNTGGSPFTKPQRGKVVENKDPEMKGRIKVLVPGILEGDKTVLPWALPVLNSDWGESGTYNKVCIPEIESEVLVEFPDGNTNMPYYTSRWNNEKVPEVFQKNYPDRYGMIDRNGTYYYVDKKTHEFKFHHSSGFEFTIDKKGNFDLTTPGNGRSRVKDTWIFDIPKLAKFNTDLLYGSTEVRDKVRTMSADRTIYNSHTHPGFHGPTSVPNQQK